MAFQEGPKRVKAGNSLIFTRKMRFHEVEQYSHWDFAHWDLVKIWAGKGKAPAPLEYPVANFATFALRCFIKMFFLAVMVDAVLLVSRSQYSGSNGLSIAYQSVFMSLCLFADFRIFHASRHVNYCVVSRLTRPLNAPQSITTCNRQVSI